MRIEEFAIQYPLWALVEKSCLLEAMPEISEEEEGPDASFLVLDLVRGGTALPIFTDEDLAQRYLEAIASDDYRPIPIPTPLTLLLMLLGRPNTVEFVAFDPDRRRCSSRFVWPAELVISNIGRWSDCGVP